MNLSIPKEVVERLEQEAFFLGCSAQELVERVIKEKFKPIKRSTQSYPEYKVFMDAYFVFFDQQTGVNPKISAADGKAAKSIIKHLRTVNEGDAVNNWISILAHLVQARSVYQEASRFT